MIALHNVCWASNPLDQWTWRNPLPQGNDLYSGIYANGTYVAIGYGQTLVSSVDGLNWTSHLPPFELGRALTYGNGQFLALGASSSDGVTWAQLANPPRGAVSLTFGKGVFVATGGDYLTGAEFKTGVISTSQSGNDWRRQQTFTPGILSGLAYGNGIFVAIGGSSSWTSIDGMNWTLHAGPPGGFGYSYDYDGPVLTFGNGLFVAGTGTVDSRDTGIQTSSDGVTWTKRFSGTEDRFTSIAYGNGLFVAVGSHVGGSSLFTSADGVTWTSQPSLLILNGVFYGNGLFVLLGKGGTILTSVDGFTWQNHLFGPTENLTSIAHGNDRFVAVGERGIILSSADAVSWARATPATQADLADVTFGNGLFVAVGRSVLGARGPILSSADAVDWTNFGSGTSLNAVTLGKNLFIAVGEGGTILSSADGVNWTARSSGTAEEFADVGYGNGHFVAITTRERVFTSPDGISWMLEDSSRSAVDWANPGYISLRGTAYGNGLFVGADRFGLVSSMDGIHWTAHRHPASVADVAYGRGIFVTVGGNGSIMTSGPIPQLDLELSSSGARVLLTGFVGHKYQIQSSTDFRSWESVRALTLTNATEQVIDNVATNLTRRFYRAAEVP